MEPLSTELQWDLIASKLSSYVTKFENVFSSLKQYIPLQIPTLHDGTGLINKYLTAVVFRNNITVGGL